MKKVGGLGSALSGLSGLSGIAGSIVVWTPASATTDGGVLPHTWQYALASILYQDSGKTTPVTADGDPVGAAVNQGSDIYDIVQATSGAKPTYKTGILNGQPVLRFDGGDSLIGAFAGGAISQPYTIFVVSQLSAGAVNDNNTHFLTDGNDATNRAGVFKNAGTTPDSWALFAGANLVGGNSDSDWNIWTILPNGASSQFWDSGVSEASGNAGANSIDGLAVGARYDGTASWWIGDIAEVLIYTGNLSTADKNQVAQYLSTKYAIAYTPIV